MSCQHILEASLPTAAPLQATSLPDTLLGEIDRSSPVPLYFQLATCIERAISDGTLAPGARLENEIALSERLNLSRPTVRRALQDLVDKGLLVRRRGIGTQVVQGQVTRNLELTSLYDDLAKGGKKPSTTLLSYRVEQADGDVAARLFVEVGSPVLHLRRLRMSDAVPLALLENYLPADFIDLGADDLVSHGLYHMMRSRGTTLRVAHQRIGARAATSEESRLLEIRRQGPVLTMDRTAYDTSGRAVEFGHHCYRPDRYNFEVTLVDN